MQELFSKVNTEKRHLYGENGILGHRRAISTTIPAKNSSSGHRRTFSNTSSDFKAIFCTSPALLKQIEQIYSPIGSICSSKSKQFLSFLEEASNYFVKNILPSKLRTKQDKTRKNLQELNEVISILEGENSALLSTKSEIKFRVKQELENKKNSDIFLSKFKKKTNELEISLKKAQESFKAEKRLGNELITRIDLIDREIERNVSSSLRIKTSEDFASKPKYTKSLYGQAQGLPLTPSSKQLKNNLESVSHG